MPTAVTDFAAAFGRRAPLVLEIGFGMGDATAAIAAARPETDFLGIEVHPPGVGALLKRIGEGGLTNLRIVQHDAVEVLEHMIAPASLAGVHLFFPDPWHKARHHKRRLVQPAFVRLLASRLGAGATLHCATDWEPYAEQMLEVLSAEPGLRNTAPAFAERPALRPLTKFENRGLGSATACGTWCSRSAERRGPRPLRPPHSAQLTSPEYAVASTTMPKAMRYQANGTKVWVEM